MSTDCSDMIMPGLLIDEQIAYLANENEMITPFVDHQVRKFGMSYGLSSTGYDVRCTDEFKIFTNVINGTGVIDPLDFDQTCFVDKKSEECIIPPNSFILTRTLETFKMPEDVMALCFAKSTLARCGVVCGVTPIECGFRGTITLELSNTTPLPVRIRAFTGICQFIFLKTAKKLAFRESVVYFCYIIFTSNLHHLCTKCNT